MAKIVIIKDGARFKVTSNTVGTGWDMAYIWPVDIEHVTVDGYVTVSFNTSMKPWEISFDGGDGTWEVDSIDITGSEVVEITSNSQLASIMADIKG